MEFAIKWGWGCYKESEIYFNMRILCQNREFGFFEREDVLKN